MNKLIKKGGIVIKRIFLLFSIFSILLFPNMKIYASDTIMARIGNNYFGSLEDAIEAASSNDTILLTSNIKLDETLEINKKVNINLKALSLF